MGKKILIVDDDADFVAATRAVLESKSYQVAQAHNEEEALRLVGKEEPDLVILDVMMEHLSSGFEVCRRIKQDRKSKDIPIIMLTAVGEKTGFDFKGSEGDERWLPADDYLDKPVEPAELLAHVGKLLGE